MCDLIKTLSVRIFILVHHKFDDIYLWDFQAASNFKALDITVFYQVISQTTADAEHGLKLRNIHNVRIIREHHLIEFSKFIFLHEKLHLLSIVKNQAKNSPSFPQFSKYFFSFRKALIFLLYADDMQILFCFAYFLSEPGAFERYITLISSCSLRVSN